VGARKNSRLSDTRAQNNESCGHQRDDRLPNAHLGPPLQRPDWLDGWVIGSTTRCGR